MPDGNLHEVSVEIGKLTAQVASLQQTIASMNEKMAVMETKVEGLTKLKHKGAGILLGVTFVATGVGSALTLVWEYLRS